MPSSQFVQGNVSEVSSIFSGNLETAFQSYGKSFNSVLLLKLSCFRFYNGCCLTVGNNLRGSWLSKDKQHKLYCKCKYYCSCVKTTCLSLTKLSSEASLDVRSSREVNCHSLAGMMGVILAAARSSTFLATARVSTLFKEHKFNYVGAKDTYF